MHGNEFSHVSQTNSGKRRASQTTEGLRWGGGDSEKWGLVTSVSVQVPSSPSKCRGEVSLSSFNHCDTHLYKMQKIQNIHAEESDWKLISCSNFPVNSCYFFSFIIFFFSHRFWLLELSEKQTCNEFTGSYTTPQKCKVFPQPPGLSLKLLVGWQC